MRNNKSGRPVASIDAPQPERTTRRWRRHGTAVLTALALSALMPAAQAATELNFHFAPRDFASDDNGSWGLSYERLVDAQFSVGIGLGLADITGPKGRSTGLSAALKATHYLRPYSMAEVLQPYVGLEIGGATHTDRSSTTLGAVIGVRFPMAPTFDLRTDVLLAHRTTHEESLFGSDGTTHSNNIASLRIGLGFRY